MDGVMKVTQLGESNHRSWLVEIEQVCQMKNCWVAVTTAIPEADQAILDGLVTIPTKMALTLKMSNTNATDGDKKTATDLLSALEWWRKDQLAQAIMKLNLEDGKHDALKDCSSAHDVYTQVLASFTSRGETGSMELLRRLCSMKKTPKEAMATYINRASMLKIEMNRMGIPTPEKQIIAALFSGLPTSYTSTVELLENHGPWDLPGVTRRLLALKPCVP